MALEGIFDNGTLISQAAESLSGDTAYDDRYRAWAGLGLCRTGLGDVSDEVMEVMWVRSEEDVLACITFITLITSITAVACHTAIRVHASLLTLAGAPAMMRGASCETMWICAVSDRPMARSAASSPSIN